MNNTNDFIHDIDNIALLFQIDKILKHTKPPLDFNKPDHDSVLKFYQEFYKTHCEEKENTENEF